MVFRNDLTTRAADVIFEERENSFVLPRDTPYNLIHIRIWETVTLAGGIICPATPSFYSKPVTIEDVAATVTDGVLDLEGLIYQPSVGENSGNSLVPVSVLLILHKPIEEYGKHHHLSIPVPGMELCFRISFKPFPLRISKHKNNVCER